MNGNFGLLVGRTLTAVAVGDETVEFECEDGAKFWSYHQQDCCESVTVDGTVGEVADILDSPIIHSAIRTDSINWPTDRPNIPESFTFTFHRIITLDGGEVTFRWLGQSNGYYSENVYFGIVTL